MKTSVLNRPMLLVAMILGATFLGAWSAGMLSAPAAAGPNPPTAQARGGSSAPAYEQVEAVFQKHCLACHSSAGKMGGLAMESYEDLLKGGTHGPAIQPGDSATSRLFLMLEGKVQPRMPFGVDPLSHAELNLIQAWINAGARGPASSAAALPKATAFHIPDLKPQAPVVSPVGALAFSPDGKYLAVGGYREVPLLDSAHGNVQATLTGHADLVRAIVVSPDGQWLAAAGGNPARGGEVKLWALDSKAVMRTLEGHSDSIYGLAVSPDGKLLASSSYDKTIKLWDVGAGREVRTLKDHIDAVYAVAFSPDGKWLASAAADRTVKIWDAASGQRWFTMSEPLDGLTTVAFSPDGHHVAAGGYDKQIRVWSLSEKGGSLVRSSFAHENTILKVLYSPDGKSLISTSADRTIRIWDAETLTLRRIFEEQPDWVQALCISPDGKRLAAGRYDGSVSLYEVETGEQSLGPLVAFQDSGHHAAERGNSVARR